MPADYLNVLAATASAVAALAALFVAWLSLREARRASAVAQKQSAHAMDLALQNRLDPMYPGLREVLGHLDDGVPQSVRNVLIPFFVLYSDAFAAHRENLLNEHDWRGLSAEFAFWAQRPIARQAWAAFSPDPPGCFREGLRSGFRVGSGVGARGVRRCARRFHCGVVPGAVAGAVVRSWTPVVVRRLPRTGW
jgi:hypothetical protein